MGLLSIFDLEEGRIDENCIYEVDVILHLAGATIAKRWTNAYKQEIIESRILSSELLYNLVKKNQNQVKLVTCSTIFRNFLLYVMIFYYLIFHSSSSNHIQFHSNIQKNIKKSLLNPQFQVLMHFLMIFLMLFPTSI